MYKLKKDTYNELSEICNLVMKNINDLEEINRINLVGSLIEIDEHKAYLSILKIYNSLGDSLLNSWDTEKYNDISAFFAKLKSYIKYLDYFIKKPTFETHLKLTTFYDSLDELNRLI